MHVFDRKNWISFFFISLFSGVALLNSHVKNLPHNICNLASSAILPLRHQTNGCSEAGLARNLAHFGTNQGTNLKASEDSVCVCVCVSVCVWWMGVSSFLSFSSYFCLLHNKSSYIFRHVSKHCKDLAFIDGKQVILDGGSVNPVHGWTGAGVRCTPPPAPCRPAGQTPPPPGHEPTAWPALLPPGSTSCTAMQPASCKSHSRTCVQLLVSCGLQDLKIHFRPNNLAE